MNLNNRQERKPYCKNFERNQLYDRGCKALWRYHTQTQARQPTDPKPTCTQHPSASPPESEYGIYKKPYDLGPWPSMYISKALQY